jgi:molybdopterin-synthase adenylyltransferase
MALDAQDRERYSRQILFAPLGEAGQERLRAARVAVMGCGALGTFQAAALARAGIGLLRIIDRDYVEPSNLQRQWLFTEADAAEALPKAEAARRRLAEINSGVRVEAQVADLTPAVAEELLDDVDLVLDGTDNFETRYLINDFCVSTGKPWVYGAAVGAYGLTMPVLPGTTACLRCVYPQPPEGAQPTCETAGVLGTITSMVAGWQVAAAMKILCGATEDLFTGLTTMDVWSGKIRQVSPPGRDPECVCCAQRRFEYLEGKRRRPISMCGRNAVQIHEREGRVDLAELAARLGALGMVRQNEFALRFFPAPYELTIFADGRAIIKGTQDVALARSLYARYVGG